MAGHGRPGEPGDAGILDGCAVFYPVGEAAEPRAEDDSDVSSGNRPGLQEVGRLGGLERDVVQCGRDYGRDGMGWLPRITFDTWPGLGGWTMPGEPCEKSIP